MLKGKFVLNFIAIFALLMLIVWAGTAFDDEMTFSRYSYTIVGVLSLFYAWTKSADLNKIPEDAAQPRRHTRRNA